MKNKLKAVLKTQGGPPSDRTMFPQIFGKEIARQNKTCIRYMNDILIFGTSLAEYLNNNTNNNIINNNNPSFTFLPPNRREGRKPHTFGISRAMRRDQKSFLSVEI